MSGYDDEPEEELPDFGDASSDIGGAQDQPDDVGGIGQEPRPFDE